MTPTTAHPETLTGDTPMGELMKLFPGARRALFARYHIGGCQSCGFSDTETLANVCQRNEDVPVDEAIAHILQSHENDEKMRVSPQELVALREQDAGLKLLDVRSREEHEAVAIPGSVMMTQDVVQEIFNTVSKDVPLVLYDHTGDRALDAAAYFIGHGFTQTKCLAGGIDAYSTEVDPSLPRYKVEFAD
jgi:rhodanese-related sulfurtransferase